MEMTSPRYRGMLTYRRRSPAGDSVPLAVILSLHVIFIAVG